VPALRSRLPLCVHSCSCNTVQQWDMSRAVPRHVSTVSSFTGDILAACTGNSTLFTAGANGALRCAPCCALNYVVWNLTVWNLIVWNFIVWSILLHDSRLSGCVESALCRRSCATSDGSARVAMAADSQSLRQSDSTDCPYRLSAGPGPSARAASSRPRTPMRRRMRTASRRPPGTAAFCTPRPPTAASRCGTRRWSW